MALVNVVNMVSCSFAFAHFFYMTRWLSLHNTTKTRSRDRSICTVDAWIVVRYETPENAVFLKMENPCCSLSTYDSFEK